MTEEEINKKAEKHCNEVLCNAHEKCNEVIKCRDWRSRRAGFFSGYIQALKDLEKENAELKERLKEHESVGNEQFWKNVWSWKIKAIQLTKAKEILREYIRINLLPPIERNFDDEVKLFEQAEQFLKEVEK